METAEEGEKIVNVVVTADIPKTSLNHDKEYVCALLTGTLVFPPVIGSMQQIKIISELKMYVKTSIRSLVLFIYLGQ